MITQLSTFSFTNPPTTKGNTMKHFIAITALSLSALSAQAKDIVDTAVAAGNFKTLATALQAAGLVDTLKGKGPFTVFAPTDEAFAKVPKADLEALLKDKAKLTAVLTYHVVPGLVLKAGVPVGAAITTVQGATFTVNADLAITDVAGRSSNIVATDVLASNGVIHVIDKVILPTP